MTDTTLQAEAQRKSARSVSRKTGKPVSRSAETLTLQLPVSAGMSMSVKFNAPAQIDENRAANLARLQLAGFFYMLTYDTAADRGYWWPGGFYMLHGAIKSDWGNPIHRSFMAEVASWDHRLILTTAGGYYRAMIRRHPSAECWAWAVEWNDCYRLVGFFGDHPTAREIADRMSELPSHSILEGPNQWTRYRIDESLAENEDTLFAIPAET